MPPAATRPDAARVPSTLYLAFELGNTEWKLAMTTRIDQAPLVRGRRVCRRDRAGEHDQRGTYEKNQNIILPA